MDSFIAPLERVVEAAEWFVRTPSLRLLHVTTSSVLRNPVLSHLTAAELLDANRAPFFVLEAPTEPGDDGWSFRTEELRLDWDVLREGAPASAPLPALAPPEPSEFPLAGFAFELGRALSLLPPSVSGLVVVLAPVWIRDAARWQSDLELLLRETVLTNVRFVVVETDTACTAPIVRQLSESAEHVDATVDLAAAGEEADARLAGMKAAPRGATGVQLVGGAGPSVLPPPRGAPPSLSPEARAAHAGRQGVAPVLLDSDAMRDLRVAVLSAAAAMRDGDLVRAVGHQREARDFCTAHGLERESIANELILGGYVLSGGSPERALDVFEQARARASAAGLGALVVQAGMAIGACMALSGRQTDAAIAYAEAGRAGAESGSTIFAIEAYRTCGQLRLATGDVEEAARAFRRALDVADAGGAEGSSAIEAARALATLCRSHGLTAQADSLEAQAGAMDTAALGPDARVGSARDA